MGINIISGERVYADTFTVGFNSARRAIKAGCVVSQNSSGADMSIDVSEGFVYFDNSEVTVSSTNLPITASDGSYDRMDLVVVNSVGVVSVIDGNPEAETQPPFLDIDNYVLLARVTVESGVTEIYNADIKDQRVMFSISSTGSGEKTDKYVQEFNASTSNITITHSLNTTSPIFTIYDDNNYVVDADVSVVDENNLLIELGTPTTGRVVIYGGIAEDNIGKENFLPETDDSYDIGSSSYRWKDGYFSGDLTVSSSGIVLGDKTLSDMDGVLYFDGSPVNTTSGITITSDLVPEDDSVYDLGSNSYKWKDGYFSGDLTVSSSGIVLGTRALSDMDGVLYFDGSPVNNNNEIITAGENLTSGNICYLKSDGKYWKANANSSTTSKGRIVIVTENINTSSTGQCVIYGDYTTSGLTTGAEYFISDSTAGEITDTAPTTSTSIVRIIGYAKSTTTLFFDPSKTYIQIT
jgi:hypothetical protein